MKDPAFLFYSKDWIEGTAELSVEAKGIYIDLLAYQHQKGNLPTDLTKIARLVRMSVDTLEPIWEEIKDKFIVNDERMVNRKLNHVMNERSEKGKRNRIIGTYASLLRKEKLSASVYKQVKESFKPEDFMETDSERLTEWLTEWLQKRLKSIANANEDVNVNEDINYDDFLKIFNELSGKNCRVIDKKTKGQLNARLSEGFTFDELKTAIINCKQDPYHIENPKYLTPEFITRADKLQKYLNSAKAEKKLPDHIQAQKEKNIQFYEDLK